MVDNRQKRLTRRGIIKSAPPALIATSLFATNASASEDRVSDSTNIVLDDGELVYKGPKQTVSREEARESSEDFSPSDLDEYMQKGVEGLNNAKSDDHIKFEERDGELLAVPTDKGREFATDNSVGLMCGTNGHTTGTTLRGPYHAIKMDDGLSTDVASLMMAGTTAGALATKISGAIGGIPVSILGAITAALSTLGAGLITNANDGCGVVIRHYPHLGVVPGVGLVFRSQ